MRHLSLLARATSLCLFLGCSQVQLLGGVGAGTSGGVGGQASSSSGVGAKASSSSGAGEQASSSSGTGQQASGSDGASSGPGGAGTTSSGSGTGGVGVCLGCIVVETLPAGSGPYGLFVDTTNIYWTNSGSGQVMQAKLDGADPITLMSGEPTPISVQVADGKVYWVSYSITGVMRSTPIGGGAVTNLTPAPAARQLYVSVPASTIFWTREPDDVQSIPLTGEPDGGAPNLLSACLLTNGITADDSMVYFVDRQDGNINNAAFDLSNANAIAIGNIPWDIVVDGTNAYWTEQGDTATDGAVNQANKLNGSNPVNIAMNEMSPAGIAVDATYVYWSDIGNGTINRAPIGGGPKTVLATIAPPAVPNLGQPMNVAVDSTFVYWTDMANNLIVKIAK